MPDVPLPKLSCAFAPHRDVVRWAQVAEDLGYHRAWLFDSPSVYGDLWIALARLAEGTSHIGLGSGVAVPSLRHPMVTASAIATIEDLSPGRLVVAFGTGFTARVAMGRRPMKWAEVSRYVKQVRRLLDGATVEIDGSACQMIHSDTFAPARPIEVSLRVAPSGPKGFAVARELGGGVVVTDVPPEGERGGRQTTLLAFGSVIRPGEDHTSRRLVEAVGPAYATTVHGIWEFAPEMLASIPGGEDWSSATEAERVAGERHLAVHQGHLTVVTDRDRPLVAVAGDAITAIGWTGTADEVSTRIADAAAAGVTEIAYIPAGPDIKGELEAFASAAASARPAAEAGA